ncbi:MAG: hypothetical protein GY828_08185 [Candidatus Gracilibacteria bacterium]|nr:hypothetical protein [Candidatus Gracilibacteria bacterium]
MKKVVALIAMLSLAFFASCSKEATTDTTTDAPVVEVATETPADEVETPTEEAPVADEVETPTEEVTAEEVTEETK